MKDGGQAFPGITSSWGDEGRDEQPHLEGTSGMSLRDYFAAKAMQAYIAHHPDTDDFIIARLSYALADAMIEVREDEENGDE
jgi:sirohydrochlorin ferrochelatase